MVRILGRSGDKKPGAGPAVAALICVLLAAGCGSSPSSSSQPSSSARPSGPGATPSTAAPATPLSPAVTGTGTSPGIAACATSGLNVTLGAPEGYAGGVDQAIVFTNRSGAACTLYGYPGVSFVSAPPYSQIGLAAQRGGSTPVKLVTLAPGASANAMLQIVNAGNFGPSTCGPTQAAYLRVYPPNQTVPVYLANTSQTCAQPVQTLTISPVQAGSGGTS